MKQNILKGQSTADKKQDVVCSDVKTLSGKEAVRRARSRHADFKKENNYQCTRLFDNGQTVIDYYRQSPQPNTVVITFDDMKVTLNDPPFGFKALMEQQTDIIAVRKRDKKTFQQDLTKEVFERAVGDLVKQYADRVAYGFSLGAYLALYLTADMDVRILSLSPRIPSHPFYGEKKFIDIDGFNHNINMPVNGQASPVIVYDPKNKTDEKYVNYELRPSFPYGRFVKVPYGGHSMATHLLHMGILKTYILTFIHCNQVPEYKGENKCQSYIYYRNLAKECEKHYKLNWAENLADRSLRMETDNKRAAELKVNVLIEKGQYNQAVFHLEKIVEQQPDKLTFRIKLFDNLMEQGKTLDAKRVLDQSLKRFGRRNRLVKREKKVAG